MRRLEYRDQLLIKLAIESGLRISDILKLTVGHIQNRTMTVFESKSRRERTFKISSELHGELKKLTKYRKHSSILFCSARSASKPIHRSTIHRKIKKALKTLKFDASAHSMRKLYAHSIFDATHDLVKVQEALHHRNISTTCAYLDMDLQMLGFMLKGGTDASES
jgi:integrase